MWISLNNWNPSQVCLDLVFHKIDLLCFLINSSWIPAYFSWKFHQRHFHSFKPHSKTSFFLLILSLNRTWSWCHKSTLSRDLGPKNGGLITVGLVGYLVGNVLGLRDPFVTSRHDDDDRRARGRNPARWKKDQGRAKEVGLEERSRTSDEGDDDLTATKHTTLAHSLTHWLLLLVAVPTWLKVTLQLHWHDRVRSRWYGNLRTEGSFGDRYKSVQNWDEGSGETV